MYPWLRCNILKKKSDERFFGNFSIDWSSQIHFEHWTLLTGTPVQNNVEKLWSLLHFLHPNCFGDLPTFLEHFGVIEDAEKIKKLELKSAYQWYIIFRILSFIFEECHMPNILELTLKNNLVDILGERISYWMILNISSIFQKGTEKL